MCCRFNGVYAVVLAGTLSACGGGSEGRSPVSNTPPPTTPEPVTPSGPNWSFRRPAGQLTGLEGSFNASGNTVTAVLSPLGESCFQPDLDRALFTGTRSGRAIQLRSQPLRGQVIELSGNLSTDGEAFEGVYSITGGCANGATNPIAGRHVDLTGVWNGKLGNIPTVIDLQMANARCVGWVPGVRHRSILEHRMFSKCDDHPPSPRPHPLSRHRQPNATS